jgi:hypothetical protein
MFVTGKTGKHGLEAQKGRNRVNYKDFRNVYAESIITDLSTSVPVYSGRCMLSM